MTGNSLPPPGACWVCAACGRVWRTRRYDAGDTSCVVWANLCRDDDTLTLDQNGRAISAVALEESA